MGKRKSVRRFGAGVVGLLIVGGGLTLGGSGCGSGDATPTGTPTPAPTGVLVTPNNVTLLAGRTQDFNAVVVGQVNTPVTWQVAEGTAGGTVSADGLYTAPNTPGTYRVVATSVSDATRFGTATVNVQPANQTGVSVSVSPPSVILQTGGGAVFAAQVNGTTNQNVVWTIQEGSIGGNITQNGSYTAPLQQGTYTVIATSVADPTASGSATVNVQQTGLNPFP